MVSRELDVRIHEALLEQGRRVGWKSLKLLVNVILQAQEDCCCPRERALLC
jgi:hypothetical protein